LAINEEQVNDYRRRYGQVVARAWSDDDYKARFIADPTTVMREAGIELPGRAQVKVVENTPHLIHLILPPSDLRQEDLAQVAGGLTMGTAGSAADRQRSDERAKEYVKIVARARADERFKRRFLVDPAAAMREDEVEIPEGVELRALESTDSVFYIALPPPPGEDVSEEDLALVAGGGSTTGSFWSLACLFCPISTAGTASTMFSG
jgi:hypothetical protein